MKFIATSRISQMRAMREAGICKKPLMLIRIPMLSELPDVVELCDISLQSDITVLRAAQSTINWICGTEADAPKEPEPIVRNVADLLDDLIEQSVQLVGTPVTLMTKDDKVRAIRYLNDAGAFLITKSGPKVCKYFGISKYTLYSYLDEAKSMGMDDDS